MVTVAPHGALDSLREAVGERTGVRASLVGLDTGAVVGEAKGGTADERM